MGNIHSGAALAAFEQGATGVTARLARADGEAVIHARYLIGAAGGRSLVRNTLGVDFHGRTLAVRAVVADVRLSGLDRDACTS